MIGPFFNCVDQHEAPVFPNPIIGFVVPIRATTTGKFIWWTVWHGRIWHRVTLGSPFVSSFLHIPRETGNEGRIWKRVGKRAETSLRKSLSQLWWFHRSCESDRRRSQTLSLGFSKKCISRATADGRRHCHEGFSKKCMWTFYVLRESILEFIFPSERRRPQTLSLGFLPKCDFQTTPMSVSATVCGRGCEIGSTMASRLAWQSFWAAGWILRRRQLMANLRFGAVFRQSRRIRDDFLRYLTLPGSPIRVAA